MNLSLVKHPSHYSRLGNPNGLRLKTLRNGLRPGHVILLSNTSKGTADMAERRLRELQRVSMAGQDSYRSN